MSTALQSPPAAATRQPRTIADIIQTDRVKEQMAMALPKWLTPERMTRIALTTINRDSNLQNCTPESVLSSLMKASAMGIEPDGRLGHLIARFNSRLGKHECTFVEDYKGLVALARRSGNVHDIYAEDVRENDIFIPKGGLHRDLIHEIDVRRPRGEIIACYAVIIYKEGPPGFAWLSADDINTSSRDKSDAWQAFKAGKISKTPWSTDYREMCKKTMLKLLLKTADLSPDVAERTERTVDVDATVTPGARPLLNGPTGPAAAFPGAALPDANSTEPLTPPLPEPPAGSPRRLPRATRQAKAQEVPHPTPAEAQADAQSDAGERMAPTDDMPLPGGEPEPVQRELAPVNSPKGTPLELFRMEHPDAEDRHLLGVLKSFQLVKEGTEKLADVPVAVIERAREDPGSVAEEVARLITKEG